MPNILIADSGSTKTDWILLSTDNKEIACQTSGLNPFIRNEEDMVQVVANELEESIYREKIDAVHFYGAGIKSAEQQTLLQQILEKQFSCKEVHTYSDLLAAARATGANSEAICCILGTGSNSCFYNGKDIVKQNPSLGYILGDEGGGTALGKKVLQYYFYNTFDEELAQQFKLLFEDDIAVVLRKIYREPLGNRYLAGFSKLLLENRGHYMVENILEDVFLEFYNNHLQKYREVYQHPIHFVGAIGYHCRDVLSHLNEQFGFTEGLFLKSPIEGLKKYHQHQLAGSVSE